jgi:hypothetical protein
VCTVADTTTCDEPAFTPDGTKHDYTIKAANADAIAPDVAAHTSPPSTPPLSVDWSQPPDGMSAPTATVSAADTPGDVHLSFQTVPSNGVSLTVECGYSTNPTPPDTSSGNAANCGSVGSFGAGGGSAGQVTLHNMPQKQQLYFFVWEDNGSSNGNSYRYGQASSASAGVTTNSPPTVTAPQCGGPNGTTVTCSYSAQAYGARSLTNASCSSSNGNCSASNGTITITSVPQDAGTNKTVTVTVNDNGGGSASNSGTYNDPPVPYNPQWQVRHNGTCSFVNSSCQLVQVRLVGYPPGGTGTCHAVGSTGIDDWGPITLTAGADGTSGWTGSASQGPLFDTNGSRYQDGTFNLGYDNSALTCN